jgi:predicted Zn-dependent protease
MGFVFLLIVLAIGLGILGWLLWRKLPQLRILDPLSIEDVAAQRLKVRLMRQRIERAGKRQLERAQKFVLRPTGRILQEGIRRVAGKLTAVERSYQKKRQETGETHLTRADLARMVEEGKALIEEESFDQAERRLIEVISNDPRHVDAYETLGRLYLRTKDLPLAKQTFTFLHKLVPEDASVMVSLGEIAMQLEKPQEAFAHFRRATQLRPKNPKYLDFLTQAALAMGDAHEAQEALDRLTDVNPDNQKIPELEEEIRELREEIKAAK